MGGILWLASFPKSGNTWLRAFLANYLANARAPVDINSLPNVALGDMRADYYVQVSGRPEAELSWPEINQLRPRVHAALAGARAELVIVKTHTVLAAMDGVPTITPQATWGAIYVVRNPLDVAVSFADHYGLMPEEGAKAVCFSSLQIEPKPGHILQPLSDWTSHVESWRKAPGLRLLLLRYEDMIQSPRRTFASVPDFLGMPNDRERLQRAIRHSSFRVLAEQEKQKGFVERSRHAAAFFRRGEIGGYRKALPGEQVQMVVDRHRALMTELGYLDGDRLLV